MEETKTASCYDCDRPYGHRHGFPDLVVSNEVWQRISPTGDEGGLLCPSCICKRLHDVGMSNIEAAFFSGPIQSVSYPTMFALRWTENLREQVARLEEQVRQLQEK